LKGGGGSDTLFGGGGADTLKGGNNADFLHGEAGADVLEGGGGSDVYVFSALADSAPDAADTIAGMKANDWIDLSPVDADPDKPGDQAFSPDQVILAFDKETGESRIEIDADGDTTADFLLIVAAGRVSFDQLVL
jgi:serralysin